MSSSSSSRSHLVVGSLRQTQFSSSHFCHGPRLSSFRWLSCLGWHRPSISASVFLAFFSRVVPSPECVFRRSLGLASLRGQTTWVALSCTSLRYSLPSVSPWCFRFSHDLLACGRMPICTSAFLSLPFFHVGAGNWHCLHPVQHSWLRSSCGSFPSRVVVPSCRIGRLTSSSSCSIHTVSSWFSLYSCHHRSAGCFPDI